jgi:hypothetical protein
MGKFCFEKMLDLMGCVTQKRHVNLVDRVKKRLFVNGLLLAQWPVNADQENSQYSATATTRPAMSMRVLITMQPMDRQAFIVTSMGPVLRQPSGHMAVGRDTWDGVAQTVPTAATACQKPPWLTCPNDCFRLSAQKDCFSR